MRGLLIAVLFCTSTIVNGQTLTDSKLPIIKINTLSQNIQDDPRINCEWGIIDNGAGQMNNINDPFDYQGHISIEVRGSTSQQYPKKNYGLSTTDPNGVDINVSLLNMPPENDWILYGPYPDKTLIRNVMTFDIFRKMGHYASNTRYCELLIDDDYRGIYILMEKIKRDPARVNVTPLDSGSTSGIELTGGYVFKVDKTTGTTVETFVSAYNPEVLFQYHDPGPDELDPFQKSYLQSFVSDYENMLDGTSFNDPVNGYHSYIDKESFYDFFIMQEIGRTVDGYRSSSFLFKDRDDVWGGKLHAGPIWDFNLSYGNADYCDADQITGWQYNFDDICGHFSSSIPFWWEKLLSDSTYSNGMKCRWEHLRQGPLHIDTLHNFIDSVALYLEDARIRNFQKWPIIGVYVNWNGYVGATYQADVDYLKSYLQQRIQWMDANLPGTCWPEMLDIETPNQDPTLSRAWPNPFIHSVNIGFTLKDFGDCTIKVYNSLGQLVYSETFTNLSSGHYLKTWDDPQQTAGQYIISIHQNGNLVDQLKVIKQ